MSNAEIRAGYIEDAADVLAELTENGYRVSFGNLSAGATPVDRDGPYVETGEASVFPLEWMADFSSDVRADDRFYMVSSEIDIEACKRMIDGQQLEVVLAKPFMPDGETVVFYEIQVRG